LRLQNYNNSSDRIIEAINETRESASQILRRLEEIQQMQSNLERSLEVTQTPSSVDTAVETIGHISRNTEAMMGAAGLALDSAGNFIM
jgi:methyl-accepting chemotaxis protein